MPTGTDQKYLPIGAYAIIGDTQTAALVGTNGSIDWCCWPRFDSAAVFCRLLDASRGGFFQIRPASAYQSRRRYIDATNVLETTFQTTEGAICLTDCMPLRDPGAGDDTHRVLRRVQCLSGSVNVAISCRPTFDFAQTNAILHRWSGGAHFSAGHQAVALTSPVPLEADGLGGVEAQLKLSTGDEAWFDLTFYSRDSAPDIVSPGHPADDLTETIRFWTTWSNACTYQGNYRDLVVRSALALKLLTYEPTGALVAAPTCSLPEQIGGIRNWDYRYTWLRDSALIIEALQAIGYRGEAARFLKWLENIWATYHGDLRIMYTLDGIIPGPERILDHLEGYRGSRPVRVGNAAVDQIQLDIFGEVLDTVHLGCRSLESPDEGLWSTLAGLADQAMTRWKEADRGIWEIRDQPRQFLHSKLLCWVALDRAIKLAESLQQPAGVVRWRQVREEIRKAILDQGYSEKLGAFSQALNTDVLDASALAIPIVGFLPATDPRVRSTVAAIRQHLTAHGLVYRYLEDDGLPDGEATFAPCSFWLVDNLALSGEVDEGKAMFEHIVSYANDVGLMSEEINPASGELLGNFPQGFSHLALILSALHIAKAQEFGPERHAKTRADRAQEMELAGSGQKNQE